MMVSNPSEDAPEKKTALKVACSCRCEREAEAAAKKAAQEAEARERWEARNRETVEKLRFIDIKGEKYADASFQQFKRNQYNEQNLGKCLKYTKSFDSMLKSNQGLLFWGNVGTGKSYAAACIANELLGRKYAAVMTNFVKLLNTFMEDKEAESVVFRYMERTQLLVLDDLGAERDTAYAMEKVYDIVDARGRQELPTIFTTNLTIEEMKRESDRRFRRIYDRIFENCYPIQFVGPSWRRREASRRFAEMEKLFED